MFTSVSDSQSMLKYKFDQYLTLWLANPTNFPLCSKMHFTCETRKHGCAKPPIDIYRLAMTGGRHTLEKEHPRTILSHTPPVTRIEAHTGSISSPICCTDLFTKDSLLGFPVLGLPQSTTQQLCQWHRTCSMGFMHFKHTSVKDSESDGQSAAHSEKADQRRSYAQSRMNQQMGIWRFPEMGVPQDGWLIRENSIKMDDWGVPLFQETTIWSSFTIIYPSYIHHISIIRVQMEWQNQPMSIHFHWHCGADPASMEEPEAKMQET